MPKPPNIDGLEKLKFITNYFLLGCAPPLYLVIDFSKEPLEKLALLYLGLDIQDIVEGIFEPHGGRHRESGRHGRKSRRFKGFPDPNDMVAERIRAQLNPYDAFDFGPVRKAFKIWDKYQYIEFTSAALEALTDVGFDPIWGIMNVKHNHCLDMARISRSVGAGSMAGGVGPPFQPFPIPHLDFTHLFFNSVYGTSTAVGEWNIAMNVAFTGHSTSGSGKGVLALNSDRRGIIGSGYEFSFNDGDKVHTAVHASCLPGETVTWGFTDRVGFYDIYEANVLAYSTAGFL